MGLDGIGIGQTPLKEGCWFSVARASRSLTMTHWTHVEKGSAAGLGHSTSRPDLISEYRGRMLGRPIESMKLMKGSKCL